MLMNFLKVGIRNFQREAAYSWVNILGLAAGFTCCILIALFVWDELSYDRHFLNHDRVYRISQALLNDGEGEFAATTPFALQEVLQTEMSDLVEESARLFNLNTDRLSLGNTETREYLYEENFYFADEAILRIFDFHFVRGNESAALVEPGTIILSESAARRHFGDEDPMGQQLHFEGRINLTVSGVYRDWPAQSHFSPELLTSIETLGSFYRNFDQIRAGWRWNPNWTYLLLTPGTSAERVDERLAEFNDKYYANFFGSVERIDLKVQALTDIRLRSGVEREIGETGNITAINVFSIVGLLILLIACINFVNLSTARSAFRAKEIGLRKTMGAERLQLTYQFLSEAFFKVIAAVVIAVVIALLLLPSFNGLTGKNLSLVTYGVAPATGYLLLLTLFAGFVSGFYPAIVLSALEPVQALRSRFGLNKNGGGLRKTLVIIQFSVTAVLMIGAAVAYFQYQHILQKDLGYDNEQVLVIPTDLTETIWEYDRYKNALLQFPGIQSVSGSKTVLGSPEYIRYHFTPEGESDAEAQSFSKIFVMHDFLQTMGIELIAGRDFSEEFSTDPQQALLINRSMVDYLGWGEPDMAIGKTFQQDDQIMTVVGVTENFHYSHLYREMDPLIMELPETEIRRVTNISYIKARLNPGNPEEAITHAREAWDAISVSHPFDYFFLDEKMNQYYKSEATLTQTITLFTIVGLIIAGVGLFGLASFTISSRTKEIAIRKTMGATSSGIFVMLGKDYVKLIVLSNLVALPLAYFIAQKWLQNFPYTIDLNTLIIAVLIGSILISVAVSMIAISSQTIKAALQNPVDSLNRE
jgi:putative ABC transport system permease protein